MKKSLSFLRGALFLLPMFLLSIQGFGQSVRITGTVTDDSGAPMLGVQVIDAGNTANGAVTDSRGAYQISVAPGSSLTFSFIGYADQTIAVGNQTSINVTMTSSDIQLDELIVIGYGVQRKSDVTGAIASVKGVDLANRTTSDAAAALQGKAAGVQILNTNAAPGSGSSIRVRGYSSNSSNLGPLLIVDGLQVDNIQYIDPSMIESIEVLKDAASAAIYGAQAGNGVVLITTKRGEKGNGSVFYNFQFTTSRLGKTPEVLNAEKYINYMTEAGFLDQATLDANKYNGTDTNWAKEVFDKGTTTRHTFGFQGANDRGSFFLSINNVDDQGIIRGDIDYYKRLSGQLNAEYKIKPWLTAGINHSMEKWERVSPSQQTEFGSVLMGTIIADPLTPVYYDSVDEMPASMRNAIAEGKNVLKGENGKYYSVSNYVENDSGNPFIQRDRGINNRSEGINTRGSLYLNFTPIKGLVYTSRFGYRMNQSFSSNFTTPFYANSMAKEDNYNISKNSNTGYFYQWENFVNYNKSFGKHNLGGMAGMSYIYNRSLGVNASASGKDILTGYEDNFWYLGYLTSSATKSVGESNSESASISYFGRLSWSYDNRYNVQFNFRADAFDSSKLDKSNRWGYFPSVSAGWTISNEAFMKDFARRIGMNNLRLRASWGQNGNVNVLNNYQYSSSVSYNASRYQWSVNNDEFALGSMPSGLVNPSLTWETSEQIDIGLDARFLNNRLTVGIDYFDKMTKDLLCQVTPVYEVGITSTYINAGDINNKGLEVELGWQDRIGDFSYSINGNFSWLKNEATRLNSLVGRQSGTTFQKTTTYFEEGYKLWYLRGFVYEGVDSATGNPIFKDLDGNGIINDDDQTMIGSGMPDYTYGITLNLAYKNFDLTVFGTGVGGNEVFPCVYRTDRPTSNMLSYFYDNRWTPSNTTASMPKAGSANQDLFWSSSANVFSGAFFKIKQIQLGYTLPKSITRKIYVDNLRIYASLDDFITFSNYPGFDPETSSTNGSSGIGLDKGSYPTSKKIVFGVNISF